MLNKILELSKQFIAIKSIVGNTTALDEILELVSKNLNGFTIEMFSKNGYKSLLVYNVKKRPKKFKIILNGHLDVIPGKDNLYNAFIKGNRLYGIGSMDMKANVACLIIAFKTVAKKIDYPIALQLVTDEQSGGIYGTKHQIDKGVNADFVIAGETTNFNIVNKAKGVIWLKISTSGKSFHSAYPWRGKNAIWKMHVFLDDLKKKYPLLQTEVWQTTVSVSSIGTTNKAFNKIPDDCTVWIDIRYIPAEKNEILKSIKSILPNDFHFNIIFEQAPLQVDEYNDYLNLLQVTAQNVIHRKVSLYGAHGTSDVAYYAAVGCPGVEFGPIGLTGNTRNEWINIPSLEVYCQILIRFLLKLVKNDEYD